MAALIPVQFQLGHYTGVDQFGQACSLTVTAKNGRVMDSFTFETAGFSYDVVTGPRLKTATPGHVAIETAMALEKSDGPARMIFTTSRASTANKTKFDIVTRGDRPLSIKMTKVSKNFETKESCNRLVKSGDDNSAVEFLP